MNRTALLAYLNAEYATLIREAQILTTDAAGGLKYPIDSAYRKLAVAEADLATATTDKVEAIQALGDYYTLRRIARTLATRVDYGSTAVEGQRPRVFEHIERLMQSAAETAASLGYAVDSDGGGWGIGKLSLDFIEPETEENSA